MAGNPWHVESILAFYCLKCPECEFNSKEENNFVHHAKGQLISKCPFGIIVWTKIPTKLFLDFCPEIFLYLPGGFLEAFWGFL